MQLQYTGTPCPRTVTGFCRCFAFRIGKIRGHNGIIRNFQFRKFLPVYSNVHLPIPPYAVYNIGNQNPENLLDFVQILQEELVRAKVLPEDYDFEAHKKLVPMQPGDVPVTYADTSAGRNE